jgi:signal transduction histidine kinase/FixJ family two-component response regulator
MNKIPLQEFVKKEFLIKQIRWLSGVSFAIFILLILFLTISSVRTNREKLDAILDLNKDEILNAIVLDDAEGISQHLGIIQVEYGLDSAEIIFDSKVIKTNQTHPNISSTIASFLGPSYSKNFMNDFRSVKFTFTANFYSSILFRTILPLILFSLIFMSLIAAVSYLIFRSQQRYIQNMLIDPLIKLGKNIKSVSTNEDENLPNYFIEEIDFMAKSFFEYNILKKNAVTAELATQVAHDIRSPLEALKSLRNEIEILPDISKKKVNLSIGRIEEITYNLLKLNKSQTKSNELNSEELLCLILDVIIEKEIEYRSNTDIQIYSDFNELSYGLFSKIEKSAFKSIISNLVNNSFEAMNGRMGNVKIQLFPFEDLNIIKIIDSGLGISPEIKNSIFIKGFTTKKMGNGLGLYSARQAIESYGGNIEFTSEVGKGTILTIKLPKCERSLTHISSININNYQRIIILDDDPSFHEVWIKRLTGLESKIEHIYSVKEMFSKYRVLHPEILLLSDFELMDKDYDGIDMIIKLNHVKHSLLVTARNEEPEIQERCLKAGIKLLPKSLVNYVKVITTKSHFDLISEISKNYEDAGERNGIFIQDGQGGVEFFPPVVLIDDDKLVHINWASYCKNKGVPFVGFKSIDEFIKDSDRFDKRIKIFVDSNLSDGTKGEIESERIFNLGFKNLYLATGYQKEEIHKPEWILEVFDKSPEIVG